MKRRSFIASLGLGSALLPRGALSQNTGLSGVLAPTKIFPKERVEKRKYDITAPEVVVWRTEKKKPGYPGDLTSRTAGFVEAASDQNKILYLPGFLVRQEIRPELGKGFFLYFGATLSYLSLPRRLTGRDGRTQDRYAFDETLSATPKEGVKAGLVSVDYRRTKLVENGKVYVPGNFAAKQVTASGALSDQAASLAPINGPLTYPKNDMARSYFDISQILHFDMDHLPLNFTIELPPLLINGATVPLPVCYFEPYDIYTDKWV